MNESLDDKSCKDVGRLCVVKCQYEKVLERML